MRTADKKASFNQVKEGFGHLERGPYVWRRQDWKKKFASKKRKTYVTAYGRDEQGKNARLIGLGTGGVQYTVSTLILAEMSVYLHWLRGPPL